MFINVRPRGPANLPWGCRAGEKPLRPPDAPKRGFWHPWHRHTPTLGCSVPTQSPTPQLTPVSPPPIRECPRDTLTHPGSQETLSGVSQHPWVPHRAPQPNHLGATAPGGRCRLPNRLGHCHPPKLEAPNGALRRASPRGQGHFWPSLLPRCHPPPPRTPQLEEPTNHHASK